MKRLPLYLLISIPVAAVIMSGITMYFAFQGPSQEIPMDGAPLSKTSWQTEQSPAGDEPAREPR